MQIKSLYAGRAKIEDSTHLKLLEPLEGLVGSVIVLEIIEPAERDELLTGSAAYLERAYPGEEPDYSNAGTPIHAL